MHPVISAIRTRRSIGQVEGEVTESQIRTLIESVTWAPNHHRTRPWRFVVLRGAARERLGYAWADILATHSALHGEKRIAFRQRAAQKCLRAPVIIVIACCTSEDAIMAAEDYATTAAGTQNLLLTAEALGLGAIWRTGEMVHHPDIKAHLQLESTDRIIAMVYVGQPAHKHPIPHPEHTEPEICWLD